MLADQFQSKPAEIKRFVRDHLESARTGELVERMRMAVARGVQTPIESPRAKPTPLKSAPKTKIGPVVQQDIKNPITDLGPCCITPAG